MVRLMPPGSPVIRIAVAANTGSEAVSNGQTSETQNIVDNLKKTLTWVSDMLRDLSINEQQGFAGPPSVNGSPHAPLAAASVPSNHSSPPASTVLDNTQAQHINGLPAFAPTSTSSAEPSLLDPSDMSRKRCASSVAGDRVLKAMKLEPQDDVSLQMPPIHPPPPPPHMNTSPIFPYTTPASIPPAMSTIVEHPPIPSLPPSLPVSRPPSSSGLPSHHALNLMADIQQSHPTVPFPSTLDFNPQLAHSPPDFPTLPTGTSMTSTASLSAPLSAPPYTATAAAATGTVWPESRPNASRHGHSHTLSGSSTVIPASVLASVSHSGLPLVTTNMPFAPSNGSFNSPTHSTHPSQSAIPAVVAPATIGRMSRSSSISHSNPFAFGIDVSAPPPIAPANMFETAMQSRPSTAGLHTRPASPEYYYDEDDDGDDSEDEHHLGTQGMYGGPVTPPSANSEDKSEHAAVSGPSGRRGSRTSPSAEGNHSNEVPQEYREQVEGIFFDFLNKICSNRMWPSRLFDARS